MRQRSFGVQYKEDMTPIRYWLDEEPGQEEDTQIEEYELTSSPNDFNITTIFNFIETGAVKIPGFQRNYVWDIKRASKLIESIVIGLPIPQIFLYEEARNKFLVIDGQQRLMSIYYFIKQRFPRKEKRNELRRIFAERGRITDEILYDDEYFIKFDLVLPKRTSGSKNRFTGLNYATLNDYKMTFDLRTIRNIIVKQTSPRDDNSSIYEIFNRLNSGGVNLEPQEIRSSLYHSPFYEMLSNINILDGWRKIIGFDDPDIHMKDIEILLRSFGMLLRGEEYTSPMSNFLDRFSKEAQSFNKQKVDYLRELFSSFADAASNLPENAFWSDSKKFNISVFESVFSAISNAALKSGGLVNSAIDAEKIASLKSDPQFISATQRQTTNKSNVQVRLSRAKEVFNI